MRPGRGRSRGHATPRRRPAPERGEVGVGREPHPGGRDNRVARFRGDDDERIRIDLSLGLEKVRQHEVFPLPDRAVESCDPLEVDATRHLAQGHAFGHAWLAGDGGDRGDHDRLGVLGDEARCSKPVGQVGRQVVRVQLPLELLAGLGEDAHLTGDQLVERRSLEPVQVAVFDEPAEPQAVKPQERPIPLDPNARRQPVGQATRAVARRTGREAPRHRSSTRSRVYEWRAFTSAAITTASGIAIQNCCRPAFRRAALRSTPRSSASSSPGRESDCAWTQRAT